MMILLLFLQKQNLHISTAESRPWRSGRLSALEILGGIWSVPCTGHTMPTTCHGFFSSFLTTNARGTRPGMIVCIQFYCNDPTPTGGTPTCHHRGRDLLTKLPATTYLCALWM